MALHSALILLGVLVFLPCSIAGMDLSSQEDLLMYLF